jgi:hypothetical protein
MVIIVVVHNLMPYNSAIIYVPRGGPASALTKQRVKKCIFDIPLGRVLPKRSSSPFRIVIIIVLRNVMGYNTVISHLPPCGYAVQTTDVKKQKKVATCSLFSNTDWGSVVGVGDWCLHSVGNSSGVLLLAGLLQAPRIGSARGISISLQERACQDCSAPFRSPVMLSFDSVLVHIVNGITSSRVALLLFLKFASKRTRMSHQKNGKKMKMGCPEPDVVVFMGANRGCCDGIC